MIPEFKITVTPFDSIKDWFASDQYKAFNEATSKYFDPELNLSTRRHAVYGFAIEPTHPIERLSEPKRH